MRVIHPLLYLDLIQRLNTLVTDFELCICWGLLSAALAVGRGFNVWLAAVSRFHLQSYPIHSICLSKRTSLRLNKFRVTNDYTPSAPWYSQRRA